MLVIDFRLYGVRQMDFRSWLSSWGSSMRVRYHAIRWAWSRTLTAQQLRAATSKVSPALTVMSSSAMPIFLARTGSDFEVGKRTQYHSISSRTFVAGPGVDDKNAYSILGVDPVFDLDEKALKAAYLKLMADLHPDRHHAKTAEERQRLEQQAAAVTRANDTLKEAHTRATHLLQILGRPLEESASSQLVGHEFLLEVMHLRETIESCSSGDDQALRPLLLENEQRVKDTCSQLTEAFAGSNLDRALVLTAQLQYWNRIDETIRAKMDSYD